jgi:hypothetical protein
MLTRLVPLTLPLVTQFPIERQQDRILLRVLSILRAVGLWREHGGSRDQVLTYSEDVHKTSSSLIVKEHKKRHTINHDQYIKVNWYIHEPPSFT